jgi:hypothetical protein
MTALRTQGFVAVEWRRGTCIYKLRFRVAHRQRVLYLGTDSDRVAAISNALRDWQSTTDERRAAWRQMACVLRQASDALQQHRQQMTPWLEQTGHHWHGRKVRKFRRPPDLCAATKLAADPFLDANVPLLHNTINKAAIMATTDYDHGPVSGATEFDVSRQHPGEQRVSAAHRQDKRHAGPLLSVMSTPSTDDDEQYSYDEHVKVGDAPADRNDPKSKVAKPSMAANAAELDDNVGSVSSVEEHQQPKECDDSFEAQLEDNEYLGPTISEMCRQRSSEYAITVLQERADRPSTLERGTAMLATLRDALGEVALDALRPASGAAPDVELGMQAAKKTADLQKQIQQDYQLLERMKTPR